MAYTPELSQEHSAILRRITWGVELPMTRTLDLILEEIAGRIDRGQLYFTIYTRGKVCMKCKDKTKCDSCAFGSK